MSNYDKPAIKDIKTPVRSKSRTGVFCIMNPNRLDQE